MSSVKVLNGFSVGDSVTINEEVAGKVIVSRFAGSTGCIVCIYPGEIYPIAVKFDDNEIKCFSASEITLNEDYITPTEKFAVGDWVKITEQDIVIDVGREKAQVDKVDECDEELPYRVNANGNTSWVAGDQIEKWVEPVSADREVDSRMDDIQSAINYMVQDLAATCGIFGVPQEYASDDVDLEAEATSYEEFDKLIGLADSEPLSDWEKALLSEHGRFMSDVPETSEEAHFLAGDSVNHPSHYADGWSNGAEIIDITEHLNFNRGNAIKYIARAGKKSAGTEIEDLRKAQFYINRELERMGVDK